MGNVIVMAVIRFAEKEVLKAAAKEVLKRATEQALIAAPAIVAAVASEGLAAGGTAAAAGGAAAAAGGAAAAVGGAAAAAGGAMTIVPLALTIGGMVGSYAIYRAAETAIHLLGTVFSEPPPNPPQVPRLLDDMTQERLIQRARDTLGMDIVRQYNFCICGQTGVGMRKSTFISWLRDLPDVKPSQNFVYREDGSAVVGRGASHVTSEVRRYIWPDNRFPYIALWDIPGGGNMSYQSETYFKDQLLYAFDCLLILVNNRFTEVDFHIIRQACHFQTPIVLVITKVDQEIANECEDHPEKSLQEAIDHVSQDLKQVLRQELIEVDPTLIDVSIYAVAAKQFRKEMNNQIANDECPSMEMWPLIAYCLSRASDQRVKDII
ncbi:unnamed protein product [Rotaria magnacalcarata]|uniref:IRG-type G domain-containing protein n=1 Tax=Rotaria magnacalcarata TaxID=392030 RepID=A0A8S2P6T5_9BILA|nr:unnamed protein product [Rotaria magnacalcarata]